MGLDQYAYTTEPDMPENTEQESDFYWRKHSKLQYWMEVLFLEKHGGLIDELNCGKLELTLEDIEQLEALINGPGLPESEGGFFYGHQFQEEAEAEYKEQDRAFCEWAKAQIAAGQRVYYSCWW